MCRNFNCITFYARFFNFVRVAYSVYNDRIEIEVKDLQQKKVLSPVHKKGVVTMDRRWSTNKVWLFILNSYAFMLKFNETGGCGYWRTIHNSTIPGTYLALPNKTHLILPPFTIQTTIASSSSGNQNLNSSETPIKSSNYQLSNAP